MSCSTTGALVLTEHAAMEILDRGLALGACVDEDELLLGVGRGEFARYCG